MIIDAITFGGYTSPIDEYEHGTHVAGIIAGNGTASKGKYTGVAPGVNLLNVRVSNDQGLTYTSDVVAGLQWIYENKDTYNIRVVNLSINSTAPESYDTNPLDAACRDPVVQWHRGCGRGWQQRHSGRAHHSISARQRSLRDHRRRNRRSRNQLRWMTISSVLSLPTARPNQALLSLNW